MVLWGCELTMTRPMPKLTPPRTTRLASAFQRLRGSGRAANSRRCHTRNTSSASESTAPNTEWR